MKRPRLVLAGVALAGAPLTLLQDVVTDLSSSPLPGAGSFNDVDYPASAIREEKRLRCALSISALAPIGTKVSKSAVRQFRAETPIRRQQFGSTAATGRG